MKLSNGLFILGILAAIPAASATEMDFIQLFEAETGVRVQPTSHCTNPETGKPGGGGGGYTEKDKDPIMCMTCYLDGKGFGGTPAGTAPIFCSKVASYVDLVFANHHHEAFDYQPGGPGSGGCVSCGSVGDYKPGIRELTILRHHRYRESYRRGSFGAGVFLQYDTGLTLYRDNAANVIEWFDVQDLWRRKFVDGLNGDVKDGVFVDQINKMARDIRLYNSSGQLTTNIDSAATAVLTYYTGHKQHFQIVDLGAGVSAPVEGASPWRKIDVGRVARTGDSVVSGSTFTLTASGRDIWNQQDECQFAFQAMRGDCTVTAKVNSVSNVDPWTKAGVMLRESLSNGSRFALMAATPGQGLAFQRRTSTYGNATSKGISAAKAPYWVKLVRAGNTFTSYRSPDGAAWTQIGTQSITMANDAYVGLCVTSRDNAALSAATFDNVTINSVAVTSLQGQDIGAVGVAGSTSVDGTTFAVSGSGADIASTADSFHFAQQAVSGDVTVVARVLTQQEVNEWSKAGIMIRESLAANSTHAMVSITPVNSVAFQRRTVTAGNSLNTSPMVSQIPYWVRLTRAGNTITGYCSEDGVTWRLAGTQTMTLPQDIFVGLALTSHKDGTVATGVFDNVTIGDTPTPAGEWPPENIEHERAGRLTKLEGRIGYPIQIAYKTFTPAQIEESPERQFQIDTVTDSYGHTATFSYNPVQQAGLWVVSRIDLPNEAHVDYQYTDGKLAKVIHPDTTESTFTYGYNANSQCTTVGYDDAAAELAHRRKTVYLTNNVVVNGLNEGVAEVINQSALLARIIANGNGEVVFMNMGNPRHVSNNENFYYEGGGKARTLHGFWESRYYVDGWQMTDPALGFDSITGTKEATYAKTPINRTAAERGTYASMTDIHNVTQTFTYDSDTFPLVTTYPDGTTEEKTYDQLKQVTRYKDRLNRVTKFTYNERGSMLTREVGLLCVDIPNKTDVVQPEYAKWQWEYYPAGHAHEYLLKTEFDALNATCADPATMHRVDYEYNANHLVSKIVQGADTPGGERGETVFEYDAALRLKKVTDPVGRITEHTYDSRDRCTKITYTTYPDLSTEEFIYGTGADANLLVKKKDRTGVFTKFEFDNSGRKVKTISGYSKLVNGQEVEITDPNLRSEEVCTYLNGTDLKLTCVRDGEKMEYAYDYRHRIKSATVYPKAGTALASATTYVNNLLFCSADPYGRKTYYAYRTSDSAMIRTVRGLVPSFSLANFAAVTALTRNTGLNPDYVIEDYELDADGQRLATIDAKNIRHETAYDSRGQVTAQIEAKATPVAAKTAFEYDSQGNRVKVIAPRSFDVDPTGTVFTRPGAQGDFVTQSVFNGRNLAASVARALSRSEETTESYTYYKDGRIKDTTDARNNVWTTRWRKCCPVVVGQIDPPAMVDDSGTAKRATRIQGTDYENRPTYSAVVKALPATTTQDWWRNPPDADTLNEVTTRLDELGRPVARCVWLTPLTVANAWVNPPIAGENGIPAESGLVTRWTYDRNLTDGVGLDSLYSDYLAGLGLGVGADGSAVLATEPVGEKTLSIADGLGRTVRTVRLNSTVATSIVVDTVYDEIVAVDGKNLVQVKSIRYPQGLGGPQIVTKSLADGAGLTRKSIDAANQASTMQFDSNGNLVSVRDPNGVGFDAVPDARNRETQRTDTLDAGNGGPVRVSYREYDAHSNVVKTKDAYNKESAFVFDGLDRRVQSTDRIAGVTTFKFDKNSNLLEIKDADAAAGGASQATTVYRYDPRNLLVLEAYRDDAAETNFSADEADLNQFDVDDRRSYSYDAARRLTKRVDQAAVQTGYAYDMATRLLTRSYPDSLNDTFQYDSDSRLVLATSARYNNGVARSYDSVGRLSAEQLTIGGVNYNLSYGFDAANRRVSEGYPDAQAVVRTYTDRDQLASVSFGGSAVVSSIGYDNGGRETSRTLANGLIQARTWRSDNLPATIAAAGVTNLSYSWDANKRKTAEVNGLFAGQNNNYDNYDDEDRLTGWQRGSGDAQSWSLSKVGDWNSTVVNGVQEDRTHNAVHEILTIAPPNPAAQLVHDVKGNLTHNKNGHDYSWDNENRLVQAIVEAGEPGIVGTHSYAYDALGRRVSKTVSGVTTVSINNVDWQEVAEYQGTSLIQSFIWGTYIDEALCMVKADGTRLFYSANDLYSVYALTDGAGNVVERYMYDPYGKVTVLEEDGVTVRTASLYGNPWTFTGRRLDGETGLMYYRNRMYDVGLGRFVGRDPIGYGIRDDIRESKIPEKRYFRWISYDFDNAAFSMYQYSNLQPNRHVDPSGTNSYDLFNKVWNGRCPKAVGVDVTGSAVLGPGSTGALQAMFFADSCEVGFFAIAPAVTITGTANEKKDKKEAERPAWKSVMLDVPYGYDISISGNVTAATYQGSGWGDAKSWGGVFYGGTAGGSALGKVGVGAFWDPEGNWIGGSAGVGLSVTPGLMAKTNPQAYFLVGTLKVPECICYALIAAMP